MRLTLSLKILSVLYWWYLVVFIWSILPALGVHIDLVPPFRGDKYAWDYELLFTAVSSVWGFFLWRASKEPEVYKLLILCSLWMTFAHLIAMAVVGVVRPEDRFHLILDASVWILPLSLAVAGYRKEISFSSHSARSE